MTYCEKFTVLLTLSASKGNELAAAVGIQPSYVSRMRKGSRKLPRNTALLRRLAQYLAPRLNGELKLKALRNYTSQPTCAAPISDEELANIIYRWLSKNDEVANTSSDEYYSPNNEVAKEKDGEEVTAAPQEGTLYFRHNNGKRHALRSMITYLLSLDEPCTVRIFTDEANDWINEDERFCQWLKEALIQLTEKGFAFERIQQTFDNTEMSLQVVDRWLHAYARGAITQYYYPHARDRLHRKTLLVVPRKIVFVADSVYGQRESTVTMITRESYLTALYDEEFEAILEKCKLAIHTTTGEQTERIVKGVEEAEVYRDMGIVKARKLSVHTLPRKLIDRIRQQPNSLAYIIADSIERSCQANKQLVMEYPVIDICSIPNLADVIAGNEPIAGTVLLSNPLYYTLQEYEAHLENMLWRLEVYPNYWVIFAPVQDNGSVYIKGTSKVLFTRISQPYVLYDVIEPTFASAFCEYFLRFVESKMTNAEREASIKRIKDELRLIEAAK